MTIPVDLFYSVNTMFKEDINLSPDLEWMLQSDQVDDETLIEILALKYYQRIFRLALLRLTYPEEAHRATQETFIQAILQKKEDRGNTNIEHWLVAIAAGIFQPRKSNQEHHNFLNPELIHSIRSRQPDKTLTDRQIDRAIKKIKAQLRVMRSTKSKRASFQVIGMIGITILTVYILISFSSSWIAGEPADYSTSLLLTPSTSTSSNHITPPVRETPPPTEDAREKSRLAASLPPLSITSSPDEIRDRIQSSNQLWNTMWVDVVVSFHGSAGYVGPPFSERHQFWIDQDGGGLLVSGPTEGFPDFIERIILSPESSSSRIGLIGIPGYSKLGSQYPWFSIKTETVYLFPFAVNYLFNTINQELLQNVTYSIIGESTWAGRNAVIVELTSQEGILFARLWLEAQRGIVLRELYFDPVLNDKVIIESSLTNIDFDNSIPTMWKRPDNSTPTLRDDHQESTEPPESSDSDNANLPLLGNPFRAPPAHFDPSQSWLSFSKADLKDYNSDGLGTFHLFADDYFLGDVELVNPLQIICDRSPNGARIVFSNWRLFPTEVNDKIYWIDLHDLNLVSLDIPATNIFRINFSPDNRTVVVAGYDGLERQDSFYRIDIDSGEYDQLPIPAGFGSLAWSPDGTQLAILDWSILPSGAGSISTIQVYDIQNGDKIGEVMTGAIPQGAAAAGIPLEGWTANFHFPLQDLAKCTSPP